MGGARLKSKYQTKEVYRDAEGQTKTVTVKTRAAKISPSKERAEYKDSE